MPKPNTRRLQLSSPPADRTEDCDHELCTMLDTLGKADAFITAAEQALEESWGDGAGDPDDDAGGSHVRRRGQIEHLIEAAKIAVRAAHDGCQAMVDRPRRR